MPEIITQYPETVIEILQNTPNVRCGPSAGPPQILKRCPPTQFCRLPQGEICVYGLNQIDLMTQLNRQDICLYTPQYSSLSNYPSFPFRNYRNFH